MISLDEIEMERVKGIEPSSQAWEARILPLDHTRTGHSVKFRDAPVKPVMTCIGNCLLQAQIFSGLKGLQLEENPIKAPRIRTDGVG